MAIQTALYELQRGVFASLEADPAIAEKVKGVFDAVEEGQVHPYITIGDPVALPFSTKQKYGEEVSITIHVWSIYNGKKETIDIINLCLHALGAEMNLNRFKVSAVEVGTTRVFDDEDPRIKHGILRMKYTIQNN